MENGKQYLSIDSLNSRDDLKAAIEEIRAANEDHVHRENRQVAADTICLSLSQHEQAADPYASYSFEIAYSYSRHRYVVTTTRSPQEVGSETTFENDFEDPRGVAGYIASYNIKKWFENSLSPEQQRLLNAIHDDNPQEAKDALKKGADVNKRDLYGNPYLVTAVKFRSAGLVETLLEFRPDLEMADENKKTPLLWSISKNRNDIFNLLLVNGANIHAVNDEGENGLIIAASYNNPEALNFFLNKGMAPALQNKNGNTALEMAISHGQEETARLLLQKGALLKPDKAFLHFLKSCEMGYSAMVELLADAGVSIDQVGSTIPELPNSDATGLMTAAYLGHNKIVEFLIKKGAKVERTNSSGMTAMMFAAKGNNIKGAALLLDAGAAMESTDDQGRTPLHHALECAALNAAGYLMTRGADPSKIKNRGAKINELIDLIHEHRETLEDMIRISLEAAV